MIKEKTYKIIKFLNLIPPEIWIEEENLLIIISGIKFEIIFSGTNETGGYEGHITSGRMTIPIKKLLKLIQKVKKATKNISKESEI